MPSLCARTPHPGTANTVICCAFSIASAFRPLSTTCSSATMSIVANRISKRFACYSHIRCVHCAPPCLNGRMQVVYKDNVFLLRGNHECANMNRVYGFYDECVRRYSPRVWHVFQDVFNCMPYVGLIAGRQLPSLYLHLRSMFRQNSVHARRHFTDDPFARRSTACSSSGRSGESVHVDGLALGRPRQMGHWLAAELARCQLRIRTGWQKRAMLLPHPLFFRTPSKTSVRA